MEADIRTADNHKRTPPPPGQSDHSGKKRNLQWGKSGWAIFGTQTFGSQPPPPPSSLLMLAWDYDNVCVPDLKLMSKICGVNFGVALLVFAQRKGRKTGVPPRQCSLLVLIQTGECSVCMPPVGTVTRRKWYGPCVAVCTRTGHAHRYPRTCTGHARRPLLQRMHCHAVLHCTDMGMFTETPTPTQAPRQGHCAAFAHTTPLGMQVEWKFAFETSSGKAKFGFTTVDMAPFPVEAWGFSRYRCRSYPSPYPIRSLPYACPLSEASLWS